MNIGLLMMATTQTPEFVWVGSVCGIRMAAYPAAGAGKGWIDDHQLSAVPAGFVLKLASKLKPALIQDGFVFQAG